MALGTGTLGPAEKAVGEGDREPQRQDLEGAFPGAPSGAKPLCPREGDFLELLPTPWAHLVLGVSGHGSDHIRGASMVGTGVRGEVPLKDT